MAEKYARPEDRPVRDQVWLDYYQAYERLQPVRPPKGPIPYAEIAAYYNNNKLAHSIGVFCDAMRAIEYDDIPKPKAEAPIDSD